MLNTFRIRYVRVHISHVLCSFNYTRPTPVKPCCRRVTAQRRTGLAQIYMTSARVPVATTLDPTSFARPRCPRACHYLTFVEARKHVYAQNSAIHIRPSTSLQQCQSDKTGHHRCNAIVECSLQFTRCCRRCYVKSALPYVQHLHNDNISPNFKRISTSL